MSRILFFLVALIAVFIAVLVFAPGIIPVAAYKDRIELAASNAVGREVTIGDNLSFRIVPHTAFHVEDLEIANAEGFDGDYLARVSEADIGVKLLSLLSDDVEVDRFVLTEPDIVLARAANGAVNWNLAAAEDEPDAIATEQRAPRDISLGDMRIINGKARFSDNAAGKTYIADSMNLTVTLNSLAEPLEARGAMLFQGAATQVDIVLTSLADLLKNETGNLKMDLKIGDTVVGADLAINAGDTLGYAGPVRLDAPDLPAFAALLGLDVADAPGFDRLKLAGDVDGGPDSLRLSNSNLTFDDIAAQGALRFDWNRARPKAGGVLSTDKLDLRRYLPPPTENASGFPAWSEAPINFSSLRNIDADFDILTDAIFLNDLEIGQSRLKIIVDNGRLTADIPELAMYSGQGSGRVVVNARGATPSFSGNFDMGAVQAQPLSLHLLKHDNLLGLGSFKFNFTASGASQAEIMSSMDGAGGFDLADGALKGVNIAKIARAAAELQQGFNPAALQNAVSAAYGPSEQTDFSEFLSNFNITDGLVNAPAITLNGPYLTMTGNGTINLPLQTIDLRLSPRATDTIDGSGARAITIPMRVGGTFSKPTIGIDAEALLLGSGQNTLRDIFQGVTGGSEDDEADAAAGDDAAPEEEPTPEETALGILDSILGQPPEEDPDN